MERWRPGAPVGIRKHANLASRFKPREHYSKRRESGFTASAWNPADAAGLEENY